MFSPPAALQQQQQQQQQQQRRQQQQLQGASATRLLSRLGAVAGARRSPLGRFHALTSRPATREDSTLFTRGGGLEDGGAPRAHGESSGEEGEEGGDADANALPSEACSDGTDLGLSESDPEVWEIVSAERRRQVGGRLSAALGCRTYRVPLLLAAAGV